MKKQTNVVGEIITIYEDWAEVDGAIWYKWRLEGEKDWNWKKTAYKEKPVIYMKRLPKKEYDLLYGKETPNNDHTRSSV